MDNRTSRVLQPEMSGILKSAQRRPGVRQSDIRATAAALKKSGLTPSALEALPDGTFRWHFGSAAISEQTALDKEWAEFEAKNGKG